MKLSKIFRKYNRTLILVFMSLLLVVFLLSDVISNWNRGGRGPADQSAGNAFGEPIRQSDLRRIQADLEIGSAFRVVPPVRDEIDAFLLQEEARRMGVQVSIPEVRAMLVQAQIPSGMVEQIAARYSCSVDYVFQVIGNWLAVARLQGFLTDSISASQPRLRVAYRDQHEVADLKMSVIDSKAFLDSVEVSEEEIQKQFEEGRERVDASTEDELVFGYRLPDRVAIEYLTVDPKEIEPQVKVSASEARRHYEEHKEQYVKRVPRPTVSPDDTAAQFDTIPLEFDEVRDQVREDARATKAVVEAQRLVNRLHEQARQPWISMAAGEDGYREQPTGELQNTFERLRDEFANQGPVKYEKTGLLDLSELRALAGFGRASISSGVTGRLTAPELALRVKGIFSRPKEDNGYVLNVYEPSPLVSIMVGDRRSGRMQAQQSFIFRVIEVAPEGPPADLEQVREKVVADVKTRKAHELAGVFARNLHQQAGEVGLDEAVAKDEALKNELVKAEGAEVRTGERPATGQFLKELGPSMPKNFTRSRGPNAMSWVQYDGGFLVSTKLPEKVFELQSTPAGSDAHRVALIEIADEQKWVVAELLDVKPLYEGEFDERRAALRQDVIAAERQQFARNWYDSEKLRERTGFEPATPSEESN